MKDPLRCVSCRIFDHQGVPVLPRDLDTHLTLPIGRFAGTNRCNMNRCCCCSICHTDLKEQPPVWTLPQGRAGSIGLISCDQSLATMPFTHAMPRRYFSYLLAAVPPPPGPLPRVSRKAPRSWKGTKRRGLPVHLKERPLDKGLARRPTWQPWMPSAS